MREGIGAYPYDVTRDYNGIFLDEIDSCLWDYLRQTEKKIVLYGMGDGAEKIKSVLDEAGVPVADIMASDEFVRGHSFLGYRVKKLSEIEELYGDDFLILVCFGSQIPEVMEHIYSIAEKHELYAPNVPVTGGGLFTLDYAREHSAELEKVYGMLADEQSRRVFENVIRYKLSGRIDLLKECESPRGGDVRPAPYRRAGDVCRPRRVQRRHYREVPERDRNAVPQDIRHGAGSPQLHQAQAPAVYDRLRIA